MIVVVCHSKNILYILDTFFLRFFYCVQGQSVIYYRMSGKGTDSTGFDKEPWNKKVV